MLDEKGEATSMLPAAWPRELVIWLQARYGTPTATERPGGGQSQAEVWRVRFGGWSAIVKAKHQSTEAMFYKTTAPQLREQGVPLPACEWMEEVDGVYWLVLEDVPHPFPRERWLANPEQMTVLRRLHTARFEGVDETALYRPAWSEAMQEGAMRSFPAEQQPYLVARLNQLREAYQHLFEPECWISGDPNPTNWGVRDGGTLVLFDWERFARGTPALDLAITVPGLAQREAFEKVATVYLAVDPTMKGVTPTSLAREMMAAKAWTVVEYLGEYAAGGIPNAAAVDYLVRAFLDWLMNAL